MRRRLLLVAALVVANVWPAPAADSPKPLSEADVLALVQKKPPDELIARFVEAVGVSFAADEAVVARLKKAGASPAVLAAIGNAATPARKPGPASVLSLWVKRNYQSYDNPLHSELTINDKAVGTFTSDTQRVIGDYLKPGWNTLTLKTTPLAGATHSNYLVFRVGPVHKDESGKRVMGTVIWEFQNGTDWEYADGKHTHKSGPDTKDVTLKYQLYYAGLEAEGRKVGAGDYVLTGDQNYDSSNTPVTATVFVNDHKINTFLGGKRQVVITDYLHKGKNTIKLVSSRVENAIGTNDITVSVDGPAEYDVNSGKYELTTSHLQWHAIQGWKPHAKTRQLVNQAEPGANTYERTIPVTLDEEPKRRKK